MLATVADYQQTFGTPAGRRVLRHLMKVHGFLNSSLVEKDCCGTAFNEGGRNAVVQIMHKLKMDLKQMEADILTNSKEDLDAIL